MNSERLMLVADLIQQNSSAYNQNEWGNALPDYSEYQITDMIEKGTLPDLPEPTCGTGGCIAGWTGAAAGYAVLRTGAMLNPVTQKPVKNQEGWLIFVNEFSSEWLGLSDDVSRSLFDSNPEDYWPEPYAQKYRDSETNRERAGVASELLRAMAEGDVTEADFVG